MSSGTLAPIFTHFKVTMRVYPGARTTPQAGSSAPQSGTTLGVSGTSSSLQKFCIRDSLKSFRKKFNSMFLCTLFKLDFVPKVYFLVLAYLPLLFSLSIHSKLFLFPTNRSYMKDSMFLRKDTVRRFTVWHFNR